MKIRKPGLLGLTATVAITIALAGCSSGSADAGAQPSTEKPVVVRVQSQPSISAEPLFVGIEKGFFADEGLDVQVQEIPDISAATAALQAGKLDVAFVPVVSALTMARQNVALTLIAPGDGVNPAAADAPEDEKRNYTGAAVYVSKASGIADYADFEGKTIAVPELKGLPDGSISSVLKEAGVDTSTIEWVKLQFPQALESLKNDQIDAAFLVNPFTIQADEAGLDRIMNSSLEFFPSGATTSSWASSQKWVDENPEVVAAFQRAMKKADEYANENLDEMKQHSIDRTKSDLTPDQMPQTWWPTVIDEDALAVVNEKLIDSGFYDSDLDVSTILTLPSE